MKTIKTMLASVLLVVFSGCNGQTQKEQEKQTDNNKKDKVVVNDSMSKPQVSVKVNKQYDDKGNLIRFDSTYSYVYSSPKGSMRSGNDSVFSNFRSFFEKNHPSLMDRNINSIFFNDSLFKYDFFNDDYFQKRFELNEKMFGSMYQQMDSIKKDYLQKNYPNGQQKKNNYRK
jgi:hypothetical protein